MPFVSYAIDEDFQSMLSIQTRSKIRGMNALLIDEISMLDGHLIDVMEYMVTVIRRYVDIVSKFGPEFAHVSEDNLQMRWDTNNGFGDIEP
jgi:hypothetical protein